jgi:hypothetical protein
MRWKEHVAHMGERRDAPRVVVGKPDGERPRENLGIDGRTI